MQQTLRNRYLPYVNVHVFKRVWTTSFSVTVLMVLFFQFQSVAQPQQSFNGGTGTITDDQYWNTYTCTVTGLGQTNIKTTWGFEKLTLSIAHNNVADLQVVLVSPDGTEVPIFTNVGGNGNNFTNTGFKNTYTTPIATGTAPFNGSYKPEGDLGLFNNGQVGNGTWMLKVRDSQASVQGSVTAWNIRFGNGPAIPYSIPSFSTNLPIIKINTGGQTIPDDPKLGADFMVIDNGPGNLNYDTNTTYAFQHHIGIEQRGSSSGSAPKKSYGFETWDSNDVDIDTTFLGLPSQSDWILSASYYDKTLMRNVLSYKLFNDMGHYATRTRYCELFLDGQYQGVYVVMEKIKRDKNRVDVAALNPQDTTGDQLTGGYIIKIDKFTGSGGDGFYSNYQPSNPSGDVIYYQYEYPDQYTLQQQQKDYIRSYVDSFETALYGPDFQDVANGFRRYAGERTFMDLMLLNEMSKNVDGYRLSTYFYKDKYSKGGKLKAGPAWDYDITWMNADYCQAEIDTGWAYNLSYVCAGAAVPAHWERMMLDTLFRQHARCRWFSLRQGPLNTDTLFAYIDATVAYINSGQQRNFVTWPILGVATWPEPQPLPQTYAEEIQRLKDWITARFTWLDAQFAAMPVLNLQVELGSDTALCTGGNVVIDAGKYDNYLWSNGSKLQAIQPAQSGTYTVTVSDEFGCLGSDAVQVNFYPLPNAAFTYNNVTVDSVQFTPAVIAGDLNWSFGDGGTSTLPNPTHTYAGDGAYTVTLQITDSNGCVNSFTDTVTILGTGVKDVTAQQVKLYPNPTTGQLNILPAVEGELFIQNTTGEVVRRFNAQPSVSHITVDGLPAGVYFLFIQHKGSKTVARFLKE
jgi:subtilisin-like proprotein convertase family protein